MLILLTILLLSAAVSAYFYLYKKDRSRALEPARDLAHLRPLFMPSDAELRAAKLEDERQLKAIESTTIKDAEERMKTEFQRRFDLWKATPAGDEIVDLLNSVHNNGTLLAEVAEGIYEEWNNGRLRLSGSDLAQLIESHFWLIPVESRTPGVSFRIQWLLSSLRAGGAETLQTHDSF